VFNPDFAFILPPSMRLEKYLIILTVFTVFMDDFRFGDEKDRAFVAFDFYYYYVIWLLFILHYMVKRKEFPFWPRWFLLGILVLFTNSLLGGFASDSLKFGMIKQMLGIAYSSIAYFSIIKFENFDLHKVFRYYLSGAFWVSIWGLGEQAMHVLGFKYRFAGSVIEDFTRMLGFANFWENYKITSTGFNRVYSIMGEPYFLAVALLPAVYYLTNCMIGPKLVRNRKEWFRFGVIALCSLFTFSAAGYAGIGLSVVLVAANHGFFDLRRFGVFFIPIFLLFILPQISNLRKLFFELQVRVDDTIKAFVYKGVMSKKEIAKLNSSTFALYSNFLIAGKAFEAHPYTGAGLGSHELSYQRYFDRFLDKNLQKMYGNFNSKDANSLFIRMLSEGGLVGLSLLLVAIFAFFVYKRGIQDPNLCHLTLINQGVFLMLIVRLLRTGNYIGQGFYFFFFLYALAAIQIRQYYKNQDSAETAASIPEA
jgi:hypothetical protein